MLPRESYDVSPEAAGCVAPPVQPPVDRPPRRRRRHLEEFVRDEPLTALAIAVTAGFIIGGGAGTRVGRAALGIVGRLAVRGAVGNLLIGMLMGSDERGAKEFEKSQLT
jgi:hypothetical protein